MSYFLFHSPSSSWYPQWEVWVEGQLVFCLNSKENTSNLQRTSLSHITFKVSHSSANQEEHTSALKLWLKPPK